MERFATLQYITRIGMPGWRSGQRGVTWDPKVLGSNPGAWVRTRPATHGRPATVRIAGLGKEFWLRRK